MKTISDQEKRDSVCFILFLSFCFIQQLEYSAQCVRKLTIHSHIVAERGGNGNKLRARKKKKVPSKRGKVKKLESLPLVRNVYITEKERVFYYSMLIVIQKRQE